MDAGNGLDDDLLAGRRKLKQRIAELEMQARIDRDLAVQLLAEAAADTDRIVELEKDAVGARELGIAIEIVMHSRDLNADDALAVLVQTSRRSGRELREIAEGVVRARTARLLT